ncbi:NAD(P) transhydrogenase subunit alpha [Iodidimonas gelatinilytica]|uniref:NAD(P) transhydrogenase subunit alpha part 1 n=1 Tax=Iodidimonas gelatinilytica TaxID=1236966 RepID=A0A5A7MQZ5_9PROT|nr:NAD(P) transhydrogenase subunit alpha [Iodidimonas gelatinilytica]
MGHMDRGAWLNHLPAPYGRAGRWVTCFNTTRSLRAVTRKIAVVKETAIDEGRVAATPETVKKLIALGFDVHVETGAGAAASFVDEAFIDAGAKIAETRGAVLDGADVILSVRGLEADSLSGVKAGALMLGLLNPYGDKARIEAYAKADLQAVSLELVPRITRAQAMDVLSSQANLAGYKAVLEAAHVFTRAFPMMMTAAGTIAPARVLVMGAGVAGLQAIATARRLGGIVSATDVRLAAKEQVESLGGKFVMVEDDEARTAETEGGYAKEMSDAYKQKQAALIAETIKKQDIVITTALIPGRPAPKLVTAEMLASMKPGSVVVDLAVEQGGNCAGSKPGETVRVGGFPLSGIAICRLLWRQMPPCCLPKTCSII